MITCYACKEDKPESEFSKDKRNKSGYNSYCKQCKSKKAREKARFEKKVAIHYKGGKCVDCDGIFHQAIYEFHHLDEKNKKANPAHLINRYGFKKAKEELDKCVLLCANCHRIRHHKEEEDD